MQGYALDYNNHYNPPKPQVTSVVLKDYISNRSLTDCLEALEGLGFDSNTAISALALLQKRRASVMVLFIPQNQTSMPLESPCKVCGGCDTYHFSITLKCGKGGAHE